MRIAFILSPSIYLATNLDGRSWEMSTVGHPLSDICNLLMQFYTAKFPGAGTKLGRAAFLPGQTPGLPTEEQALSWYTAISGYDPRAEMTWGMSFNVFKLAAVCSRASRRGTRCGKQAAKRPSSTP